MLVKSIRCRSCGSFKTRESLSAYVYCDFCGTFTGWDFDKAVSSIQSAHPGVAYEKLAAAISIEVLAAKNAGDRETYAALQKRLFGAHIDDCPSYYAPRVSDPPYRAALIEYMAAQYTIMAFSATLRRPEAALNKAMMRITFSSPERVESSSFRRLYEAQAAYNRAVIRETELAGLLEIHPDRPDAELSQLCGISLFLVLWLPYLSADDTKWLLEKSGLKGRYVEAKASDPLSGICGNCGENLKAPKGARKTMCEYCGFMNETCIPAVSCPSCGAMIMMLTNRSGVSCPFCETQIIRGT